MTGSLYMLSENNFGSKSLRESSASCASLLQLRYSEVLQLRCSKHAKCCHFCKSCKFHSFFHPLKLLQGSLVPLAIFLYLNVQCTLIIFWHSVTTWLDRLFPQDICWIWSWLSIKRWSLDKNEKKIKWQRQCRWTYFLHFFFNLANLDRGQTELFLSVQKDDEKAQKISLPNIPNHPSTKLLQVKEW